MEKRRFKYLLYSIPILISFTLITQFAFPNTDLALLQTSFISVLKDIAEENRPLPPDLAIEKISLRKIGDPSENFDYYKYYATVIIKNYGGDVKNSQVTLGGIDQKYIFLNNTPEGFSLQKGKNYIVDNYEVIFDGNYNGGNITLEININDRVDPYKENNSSTVFIFEQPAKLQSIAIDQILNDGTFKIVFDPENYALNTDNFEVYFSDSMEFNDKELKYDEIKRGDYVYGYHRIKNSAEFVNDLRWRAEQRSELDSHFVKFTFDPFEDNIAHYFYVKAINPEKGYYAVSNILKFNPQESLDRAEFAKAFLDYADIEIYDNGESYYEDINADVWYKPYVQTLYNLGLINSESLKYLPQNIINRGDVLRVVLDYFDVNLVVPEDLPHFKDVSTEDQIYPYIQALYASSHGNIFRDEFSPYQPATKNYLKYLINEFKENS